MPHIAKANCYTTLENYPKAISTLNEALNFCKEKDLIFATIGANYYKMKNYEVAAIYFKKAAYLTPAYVEAWTQIALCYIEMNDFNSAIEYLNKGIEHNQKSQDMLIDAARVYMKIGDSDMVETIFNRLIEYGYDDERTWMSIIELYIENEEYAFALDMIEQARDVFENPLELNIRKVLCYYMLEKKDFAYDCLKEYVFTYPDEPYHFILNLCPAMAQDINIIDILESIGKSNS